VMQGWKTRLGIRTPFWRGVVIGLGVAAAVLEGPYVNWRPVAPPVDQQPLFVRQDAKGDGRFGAPRSGHRVHRGIDLVAPLGSPVRAICSGTVMMIGTHRGFGRLIELDHRQSLTSLYAHLDDVKVTMGQRVKQGQIIGTIGKTGNARSPWVTPHLHLEVAKGGELIDPTTMGLRVVVASTREPRADGSGGE